MVNAQVNAHKYLRQSIVDLEKVIDDFALEQKRLKTKHLALLQQTIELESELSDKELLSAEQSHYFADIQKRLSDV